MPIRPLNSWIVVRDVEPDEEKIGDIFIPEGSVETPYKLAEVLRVGLGKSHSSGFHAMEVQEGDRVLYVRFLKRTHSGIALSETLEREYGSGAFLIQEKDVIAREPKDDADCAS